MSEESINPDGSWECKYCNTIILPANGLACGHSCAKGRLAEAISRGCSPDCEEWKNKERLLYGMMQLDGFYREALVEVNRLKLVNQTLEQALEQERAR